MTFVRRLRPFTRSVIFAASTLFSLTACEIYDGDLPALDELHTPVDLQVHPSGRYLYVLNANFDGKYRSDIGGSLSVIDLETLSTLPDSTQCLPSFGSSLAFGATSYGEDEPRFLFASTKGNRGGIVFELNEAGDKLSCLWEGNDVGATCVNDIRDIPGVTKKRRHLPCEIRNVVDDPSAVVAIPPIEGVTPLEQDAFAIVSQSRGELRAINLIDGEIRGHELRGDQRRGLHITAEELFVSPGSIRAATHPLTGDTYYGSRSDNRLFTTRWAREAVSDYATNPKQGFVAHIARMGLVSISSSTTWLEIRDLTFSENGEHLYIVSQNPSSLITVDTSLDVDGRPKNLFVRRDIVAGRVGGISLVESGGTTLAYLTLYNERALAVVDIKTGARVGTVDLGDAPYAITRDPIRPRVYVALFEEHAVAVVDTNPASPTFNRQIATIR